MHILNLTMPIINYLTFDIIYVSMTLDLQKKKKVKSSDLLSTSKTFLTNKQDNVSIIKHQQTDSKVRTNRTHGRKSSNTPSSSDKRKTKSLNPIENKPMSGSVRRKANGNDAKMSATLNSKVSAQQPRLAKLPRSVEQPLSAKLPRSGKQPRPVKLKNMSSREEPSNSSSADINNKICSSNEKNSVTENIHENLRTLSPKEKEKMDRSPPIAPPYTHEFSRAYVQMRRKIKTLKSTYNKMEKENEIEKDNFLGTFKQLSAEDADVNHDVEVLSECLSQCHLTSEQLREHVRLATDVQNIADIVVKRYSGE